MKNLTVEEMDILNEEYERENIYTVDGEMYNGTDIYINPNFVLYNSDDTDEYLF